MLMSQGTLVCQTDEWCLLCCVVQCRTVGLQTASTTLRLTSVKSIEFIDTATNHSCLKECYWYTWRIRIWPARITRGRKEHVGMPACRLQTSLLIAFKAVNLHCCITSSRQPIGSGLMTYDAVNSLYPKWMDWYIAAEGGQQSEDEQVPTPLW
jgi:hypothetical protein